MRHLPAIQLVGARHLMRTAVRTRRCQPGPVDDSRSATGHRACTLPRAHNCHVHPKDRGCTAPGCDVPAYYTEVHRVTPWAKTHTTDVSDLALACGPQHKIAEQGWTTRKNQDGVTEWIPPPHLDYGQPRTNTFHHPEKLLRADDEDDP
jgi:hypothetical protein